MRTLIMSIVAILALTVQGLGHAESAVTNHWANLRTAPDLSSKKLVKIKPHTRVELVEQGENFDQIIYKDRLGWIRRDFITRSEPVSLPEEPVTAEKVTVETVIERKSFFDNAREISSNQFENFIQTISQPWITFKVTGKDEDCLARNIYYEASGEPEEGKAAVGIVTVNRVLDGGFGKTICSVVNQRTMFVRSTVVPTTEYVQVGLFGGTKPVTTNRTVITYVPVCQFSWVCAFVRMPTLSNPAWEESQRVAHELLNDGYQQYRDKYQDALYFHSTGTRPPWAHSKTPIARIGGHVFYSDRS
jgi:spore germination cell wall hydrolase CwlJ-like protein